MSIEPNPGFGPKPKVESEKDIATRKAKAELGRFGSAEIPDPVLENFVANEMYSFFNLDSRMNLEGVRNIQELISSIALDTIERKRLDLAVMLHDIGKSGPGMDEKSRLAVIKLFSLENVEKIETTTVGQIIQKEFRDEELEMVSYLSNVKVDVGMTMRQFYDMHAFWTRYTLDQFPHIFDEKTRIIAASHHIDKEINPYKIDINNVNKISNEMKFSIFLLMAVDKYQAVIRRDEGTHEEGMKYIRDNLLRVYDGDIIMAEIVRTIDQLGSSNSLFPKALLDYQNARKERKKKEKEKKNIIK